MKSKIFRSIICTIVMMLAMHSFASSQAVSPDKEKEMETKMQQMQLKLQNMQQKLDSMKKLTPQNWTAFASPRSPKALKALPRGAFKTPMPPMPAMPPMAEWTESFAPNGSFDKAFKGLNKSLNSAFSSASDEKIQEKIKSGEVKERIKTYSKSYNISSGDKLQIDNRYGKVMVNTWNKNEFKVDVEIKGIANEDDEAQKIINGVTINDSKDGSVVSFTTTIASPGNRWEMWTSKGDKSAMRVHKTEVNYIVYIPTKNPLTITNRYGNIILPNFDGKLTINNAYGNFTAKELSNTGNDISTRYTDVNIESLNGGNISCQYGDMLKIGVANNITLDTRYISTDITKLKTSGNISVRYGNGLKIGDIDKSLKSLNINSTYAPVAVGLKSGNNFDFDVTVRYDTFKYNDDVVKVTSKTPADDEHRFSLTKNYKGYVGKSNSDAKVTISTNYKGVQFL